MKTDGVERSYGQNRCHPEKVLSEPAHRKYGGRVVPTKGTHTAEIRRNSKGYCSKGMAENGLIAREKRTTVAVHPRLADPQRTVSSYMCATTWTDHHGFA